MATRQWTGSLGPIHGVSRQTAEAALVGDDFAALQLDRAVSEILMQVDGTPSGATVQMHGASDGADTFHQLKDSFGADAELVDAVGIVSIGAAPFKLKPVLVGGDGSTNVVVTVLVRYIEQIGR